MTLRLTCAAAVFACFVAAPLRAQADDYEVDNAHTAIIFGIKHMNTSYTYGRFNKVAGKYTLDAAKPEASKFQVAIDAASIDTNNAQRDGHLKSPDFFNAGEFPVIAFESTKVAAKKDGEDMVYQVTGDLKIHGVTKSVTLELKKIGEGQGPGPMGYRSGFLCATKLNRSDFGMNKMLDMVGDEVAITISFEGVRQGGGQ